jgi:acyl-CoA synthetase (AMP-forming)/AMP-acid ligase II
MNAPSAPVHGSVEANVASRLRLNAQRSPDKEALVFPVGRGAGAATTFEAWTYQRLDRASDAFARGFLKLGIGRGTKTIVMLKPSPDLYAVIFALFKVGAVPVIVDPGMGPKRMLHCYETVKAEAFIGIPLAHLVRLARPKSFAAARVLITVGSPKLGSGHSLDRIAEHATEELPLAAVHAGDTVVINFTTGSTGPARGVEYTHGGVAAMCAALPGLYGDTRDAVTFVTLPLLALFASLLGLTAVLAPMDPTKPANVDSARLAAAIAKFGCTHMFASPALLNRLGTDTERAGGRLPSLRAVISGGAPIMPRIVAQFRKILPPDARIHATYGATEALPMASVESREILGELRERTATGSGTCAGYPMPGLEVRIFPISDAPIRTTSRGQELPRGEIGEIAVRGAIVSPRYHQDPVNDALAKTNDADGTWHRTGDLGSLDRAGRLWFAGRKSHRVQTPGGDRFTVQCEGIFNGHPDVYRTALVGVGPRGRQRPVLCVELARAASDDRLDAIAEELRVLAKGHPLTREIEELLFHPGFPVDIRHNAKIEREQLAIWASQRVPHEAQAGGAARDPRRWTRLVPIAGWLFLFYGVLFPFTHWALRAIWGIDLVLSVGVHALQLFAAVPAGKRAGYPLPTIVLNTMLFGATWWKLVQPRELRGRALLSSSSGSA